MLFTLFATLALFDDRHYTKTLIFVVNFLACRFRLNILQSITAIKRR